MSIFKVLHKGAYWRQMTTGIYGTAAELTEGRIHLSTEQQLPNTIQKIYERDYGHSKKVVDDSYCLIRVKKDLIKEGGTLEWQGKEGQIYPHIVGPVGKVFIDEKAIRWVKKLIIVDGGFFLFTSK